MNKRNVILTHELESQAELFWASVLQGLMWCSWSQWDLVSQSSGLGFRQVLSWDSKVTVALLQPAESSLVVHILGSEPLWPVEHMWADWLYLHRLFLRAQKSVGARKVEIWGWRKAGAAIWMSGWRLGLSNPTWVPYRSDTRVWASLICLLSCLEVVCVCARTHVHEQMYLRLTWGPWKKLLCGWH